MIERGIIAILTDNSLAPGVVALVGNRVHDSELPQNPTFPAIVVDKIFDASDYHMQGTSGLRRPRVQINCMAIRKQDASNLAEAVLDALSGFKGSVGSPAIAILGIFHDGGGDDTAAETLNAGPKVALKRVDVICHHRG